MLNEATSRLEQAMLAPLVLLNGGAIVAFLTLLGALLGKDSGRAPALGLAMGALGGWALGLLAAVAAVRFASARQRDISAAHRLAREELERAVYPSRIAAILEAPLPPAPPSSFREWLRHDLWGRRPAPPDDADRRGRRDDLRRYAGLMLVWMRRMWMLSVALFVAGAAFALAAVLDGHAVRHGGAKTPAVASAPR